MLRPLILSSLFFVASPAFAVDRHPPGERIEQALSAQITQDGLDQLEDVIVDVVPTLIPADALAIPDIHVDVTVAQVDLTNANATIDVNSVNLVPKPGVLEMTLNANLLLGSAADPYQMHIATLFDWCNDPGHLTANVSLKLNVTISVVTLPGGERAFDVNIDLPGNGVAINSLNVNGACDTVLNIVGNALKDVLVNSVLLPQIQPLISGLGPTIEDALKAASINQSLDLLGHTIDLQLLPKQVFITTNGIEIQLSGGASAPEQDSCIADHDPGGSLKTDTPVPGIGLAPADLAIGAYVSDDFINEVLYAAFRSGVLCVNVDKDLVGSALPIALDSSLIPLIGGQEYNAIIPATAAPLIIHTNPGKVPTVIVDGAHDVGIRLQEFNLAFVTDIEARQATVIGLNMDANIGIDLPFDGATGALSINLDDVKASNFKFTTTQALIPGTEAGIETSFSGLLDTILGAALGGLSDSLAFTLPSLSGLGLTQLDIGPGGDQQDWLLAKVGLGLVSYGGGTDTGAGGAGGCGGCGGSGGCGGASCASGGGCSANGGMIPGAPLYVFIPLWLLRRRRDV